MPFILHPFAAVRGAHIVRFQDDEEPLDGCAILPVIADPDPPVGDGERLWGPDYEVTETCVRAYGKAVPLGPDELIEFRLSKLEALVASLTKAGSV